jgi:hypothetical protein
MRWILSILLLASLGATTQPLEPPAFIRQMIDLGRPDLAEAEARERIGRGEHDALAIGVIAYVYAERGEMGAAIQQLKMALTQDANEPFLLKMAGRLVAWSDSQVDRMSLTATDARMLEMIRSMAAGKPVFVEAYRALVVPVPVPPAPPPTIVLQPQIVVQPPPQVVERRYDDDFHFYPYPVFIPRPRGHIARPPAPSPPPARPPQQPPMVAFGPKR